MANHDCGACIRKSTPAVSIKRLEYQKTCKCKACFKNANNLHAAIEKAHDDYAYAVDCTDMLPSATHSVLLLSQVGRCVAMLLTLSSIAPCGICFLPPGFCFTASLAVS